jgi:pyridoxamine 5'-phosphate oxidase family protein
MLDRNAGGTMSVFTEAELAFLQGERHLGRLATVGPDGTPHVAPVGWSLDEAADVVQISGNDLPSTKKFRDVSRTGRAAIVIDDVLPPWRPRGVEVRGHRSGERHHWQRHDRPWSSAPRV